MHILLLIIPAAVLSLLMTGAATAYARRKGLLDHPGERHSHSIPTPRGGGAGLVLAFLVSAVACVLLAGIEPAAGFLQPLLIGFSTLALTGWWDDHHDLSARLRFAIQLAVSVYLIGSFADSGWVEGWFRVVAAVLFTVWMVNLYNFMDGSNGMAGSQGVFVAAVLAWLFHRAGDAGASGLSLLLMASCIGFLPWNLGRAKVFMGDVGSLALGFGIAALLVYGAGSKAFSVPVALMVTALFLADATLTLGFRVMKGERWYNAHRQHLYQRIIALGWTHARVLLLYQVINLALVLPGVVFGVNHPERAWHIAIVLGLALGLGWYLSIKRIGVSAKAA